MDESYLKNLRARLDPAYHASPSLPLPTNGANPRPSSAHGSQVSLSRKVEQPERSANGQPTRTVEETRAEVVVEGSVPSVTGGEERKKERRRVRRTRKRTESTQQESMPDAVHGAIQGHQSGVASGDDINNQGLTRQLPGEFNLSISYVRKLISTLLVC